MNKMIKLPLKNQLVPENFSHIKTIWAGEVIYSNNSLLEIIFLKKLFKYVKFKDKIMYKNNPDLLLDSFESNFYLNYLRELNNFCYDAKAYLRSSGSKIKFNHFISQWYKCQNINVDPKNFK